ncbi:tyrosine-type recombinase/integrase [Actinoallomurus vinaceus]|uniref:Tyrosine-type recombinase/integrase n=1 Tax=Actinoallomurus vinaceus TaxID=1080074 RepID=A0ABP8UV44_9ACTN
MSAKGSVYKRCGCRIQGRGRRFGNACPELARRGHGSWYYAVDIGPYPGSRRRRVRRGGFASRNAAEDALRQLQKPDPTDAGKPLTTGQWLRIWLAGRISLCPSTLRGYASHVDDYLQPHLGSIPLRALDTRHLQQMFIHILGGQTASGRPVTAATLKRIHATLRTALNAAVRERLIGDNPARYVELPPAPRPHAVVWTDDQIRRWRWTGEHPVVAIWTAAQTAQFLHYITDHRLYAAYHLIALRGLRRGEAAGLRWCDLDLQAGIAVINSQSQNVSGRIVQAPPKTKASRRTIALDHTTVTALRRHRHRQQTELAALGTEDSGYVFTNIGGRPISPDRLSINFGKLIAASGLPPIRLHDLRHGAASLALQAGADLKVVQDQLGHSSIVLTADTYVTVLPEVARKNAENVARLVLDAARCASGARRPRRRSTRPTTTVKSAGPPHQHPYRR